MTSEGSPGPADESLNGDDEAGEELEPDLDDEDEDEDELDPDDEPESDEE